MNPENFYEAKWRKNYAPMQYESRCAYLKRHSEFWELDFPKTYYFKIYDDRCAIHWAVISNKYDCYFEKSPYIVYFIDVTGRAFDKLEFKTKKQAQRALRRNKFFFSTNKHCSYEPVSPIYVKLSCGKKSAPYSKGNLWKRNNREEFSTEIKKEDINLQEKPKFPPIISKLLLWIIIVSVIKLIIEFFGG